MSGQNTIPTEMLGAAANAVKELSPRAWAWTGLKPATVAEAALQAANVPALLARIAELEAALPGRICEGCNALVANVGQLHFCGCRDQRNLCCACKAGCACAGGGG